MSVPILIRCKSDPISFEASLHNFSLRSLEETARLQFKLDSPLIIASYIGLDRERYILSTDDDVSRLFDEVSTATGSTRSTPKCQIEVETLEDFLKREKPEENAEAIKKVIHQTQLRMHPVDTNVNNDDFANDLQEVLGELQRLKLKENLIGQIRNRIVNHWAKNREMSELVLEEDSQTSNFQTILGKGRKVKGNFGDQSSINSDTHTDSSFISKISQKEMTTGSTNNSQMSTEDAEDMHNWFNDSELRGQRSIDSAHLNWKLDLDPIHPLSRDHSHDDSSEIVTERELINFGNEELPDERSLDSKKEESYISPQHKSRNRSRGPPVREAMVPVFQKQMALPEENTNNYELEGSMVSDDFDISKAKRKVAKTNKMEVKHQGIVRKESKPVGTLKTAWNKFTSVLPKGSGEPNIANDPNEFKQTSPKVPLTSNKMVSHNKMNKK